jgi:Reverse transcriptase (RNA-dependent DNA polymerase)
MSNVDHSLFSKRSANFIIFVLIYVYGIIIVRNNLEEIKRVKIQLKEKFDIKDLRLLKYFLGIEIIHSSNELFISQRKYILDLLRKIEKIECKSISISIDSKIKLNIEDGKPLGNINQF